MKETECNNQCGEAWCCKYQIIQAYSKEIDTIHTWILRGGKVLDASFIVDDTVCIIVPSSCIYLKDNLCTIHSCKPRTCTKFPGVDERYTYILPDTCPYVNSQYNCEAISKFKDITNEYKVTKTMYKERE